MEQLEKTEILRKKPVTVPFSLPHILHGQTWYRTRASVVTGHGKEFDSQHS